MKTKEAKVHIGSKGSILDKKSAESITRCITDIFESASENRISEKNISEALALFTKVVSSGDTSINNSVFNVDSK